MRSTIGVFCAAILSGCATVPRQYEWGGYETLLFAAYKDPSKTEALTVGLENQINALEQGKGKVAPGLYAELGTLYLQAGAPDKAITMYTRERDTWPESRGLMNALIQNLERRQAEGKSK